MHKSYAIRFATIALGLALLTGCTRDGYSPPIRSAPTRAAVAAATARPTSTPQLRPTVMPTETRAMVSASSAGIVQPSPTNAPNCRYDAVFVRDVTIPDGTVVRPGELVDKSWELRNTGTCHWHGNVRMAPVQRGQPVYASSHGVVPATQAGETAEILHRLVSPEQNGDYEAKYQLCAGQQCFGPVFWSRITVRGGIAPTRTPTRRPTRLPTQPPTRIATRLPTRAPTPVPHISGWTGHTCDRCIKGNISFNTGERIYHLPGCDYYEQTVINTSYGERWFSNEAEAIQAGWRKARNCP